MEYSQWQQQPPAPGTATATVEVNQSAVDAYYASYYAYYAPVSDQSQYPNPNSGFDPNSHESSATATATPVPGADAYASVGTYPDASAAAAAAAAAYQTVDTTSYYVLDTNPQNWAWRESVRNYGTDPLAHGGAVNGSGQPAVAHPGSSWTNHLVQAQLNGLTSSKKRPKKAKIVQSAYCEVCKVDCNSQNVLEQHKSGKKHQKNLEKLQACSSANMGTSMGGSSVPVIGPQENPDKTRKKNAKKAAESMEDLETKRRKVMECGAAVESIRLCSICNVVCNSDRVYSDHLAGQKHAAMARKRMGEAGIAPVN